MDPADDAPLPDPKVPPLPAPPDPEVPPLPAPPVPPNSSMPPVPSNSSRSWRLLSAIVAPNLVAMLLMWLTGLLMHTQSGAAGANNPSVDYVMADFVLIPLLMGMIAAYFLQGTGTGIGVNLLISLANTVIGIALSALILHEGVICLAIVSPLLFCFISVGGLIGRLLFAWRLRRLQLSLAPLLLLLIVGDALSPHTFQNTVTDVIVIKAPPERVWQYIIDYPAIQEKPDYWLFRMGLPAPVQSTATGHFVGAQRRCIFQGNLVFEERIIELEAARKLTFDITKQPNDPEILGHIVLQRGQFLLRDNGDGTTTVTGTSWYTLKVSPSQYYDLWAQNIIRHVHLRVMEHIRQLSESPEPQR